MNTFIKLCCVSFLLLPLCVQASNNIALDKFLKDMRKDSLNLLVSDEHIIGNLKYKKTNKAIRDGYLKELRTVNILLNRKKVPAKLRFAGDTRFDARYSRPEKVLDEKLTRLTTEVARAWETLEYEIMSDFAKSQDVEVDGPSTGDAFEDFGADIDIGDEFFEISEEVIVPADTTADSLDINQFVNDFFIEIGDIYAPTLKGVSLQRQSGSRLETFQHKGFIQDLDDIFIPYPKRGEEPSFHQLNGVFATAFYPDRKGAVHIMEMRVFLFINDLENKQPRIAVKPIQEFEWQRNPYYISAATGSVIKAIFSEVLQTKITN